MVAAMPSFLAVLAAVLALASAAQVYDSNNVALVGVVTEMTYTITTADGSQAVVDSPGQHRQLTDPATAGTAKDIKFVEYAPLVYHIIALGISDVNGWNCPPPPAKLPTDANVDDWQLVTDAAHPNSFRLRCNGRYLSGTGCGLGSGHHGTYMCMADEGDYFTIAGVVIDPCSGVTCPPASSDCKVTGTCVPATGQCSAETDMADGSSCDNANPERHCASGVCVSKCSGVTCPPASSDCKVAGTCVPATGQCSTETDMADGSSCDSANPEKHCASGACVGKCSGVTCPPASGPCKKAGTCVPTEGVCLPEELNNIPECKTWELAVRARPGTCVGVGAGGAVAEVPCGTSAAGWVSHVAEGARYLHNKELHCYLQTTSGSSGVECFTPTPFNALSSRALWQVVPTTDNAAGVLLNVDQLSLLYVPAGGPVGQSAAAPGQTTADAGHHLHVSSN